MMNRKGKALLCTGLLLIVAALALAVYNWVSGERAAAAARQALQSLNAARTQQAGSSGQEGVPSGGMPTLEIDGNQYIGSLEIPALSIELPVMSTCSDSGLKIAPCRYKGDAYGGGLIIAGHNYQKHFASLGDLSVGDKVFFSDVRGVRFAYAVAGVEKIPGTAVEQMEAGGWDLTLFTCTIWGESRLAVRCERTAA